MDACLAVTCHLHFWQNDRGLLCATVVCACIEFFGEVGHFTERGGFPELCVSHPRKADDLHSRHVISERGLVYMTQRTGPSSEPWGTPYMSRDVVSNTAVC